MDINIQEVLEVRFDPNEEYLGLDKEINGLLPLVSVCVTTYQHNDFIKDCLDGILMQKTNFPFEIIIGEDESTDGTRDICKEYAELNTNKIRLFLRKRSTSQVYDSNGELVTRLNSKWTKNSARGKYIALCEGDDYWTDPLKLQKQVDFLEENPEYSFCTTYSIDEEEFQGKESNLKFREYSQRDFLLGNKFQTRTCTVLFKMLDFNTNGVYYKYSSKLTAGDTLLKILLTENGKKAALLPFISAYYRRHDGGMWSSLSSIKMLKNKIKNNKAFIEYCEGKKFYQLSLRLRVRVFNDQLKLILLKLVSG